MITSWEMTHESYIKHSSLMNANRAYLLDLFPFVICQVDDEKNWQSNQDFS